MGLLGAVLAALYWSNVGRDEQRQRFERQVSLAERQITAAMARHEEALRAASGFFAASGDVDRRSFRRFATALRLEHSFPATDGLSFVARVPRRAADAFEARQRADGSRSFAITGSLVTPPSDGPPPDHFVTTFTEPRPSWSSLGYDLATLVSTRSVLERARDTGEAAVTSRFTPFVDREAPKKFDGFVLFVPVYAGEGTPRTVAERRESLRGWMAMRFLVDGFLPRVLDVDRLPIRWGLFEGMVPSIHKQISYDAVPGDAVEGLDSTRAITVGGRHWLLRAEALPGFVESYGRVDPPIIFGAAALPALLVFLLVWTLSRSKARADDQVERATRSLRDNERRFRTLAASSPLGIFQQDPEGRSQYANARFREIFDLEPDEDVDAGRRRALHPDDRDAVLGARGTAAHGRTEVSSRFRIVLRDGAERWVHARAAPLLDDDGVLSGFVGSVEDVTERQAFVDQLSHQALHDPLTGLANRALFTDRTGLALARARRGGVSVAVMFLDLDRFKLINDSYGHDVGDDLLRVVAERLDGAVRDGDTVARMGGDEFTILCEVEHQRQATELAKRLTEVVEAPIDLGVIELVVTTSVGVAFASEQTLRAEDVLRDADAAMYRAKDLGRARVELFDEKMQTRAVERLETEKALRESIELGELTVAYQPKVDLSSGRILGVEALVRWPHPELGSIPPDRFIPLAEETGLVIPLGEVVLREACRRAAEWRSLAGASDFTVAVNLSPRQLVSAGLLDTVTDALAEAGLDPSALILELTESALMHDTGSAALTLGELKELGVGLSLDDFGTGYSSLSYLRMFPFDHVKIDRSFVDGLGVSRQGTAIVAAIQHMADALGLSVVAEGIETDAQLDHLRRLACPVGQGFLLGKPQPAESINELLSVALPERALGV